MSNYSLITTRTFFLPEFHFFYTLVVCEIDPSFDKQCKSACRSELTATDPANSPASPVTHSNLLPSCKCAGLPILMKEIKHLLNYYKTPK